MISEDTLDLLRAAADAALDRKAFQLTALDVTSLTSLAESFMICSAAHQRQVAAVSDAIQRRLREAGRKPLHVEGERRSEWVLLDYGDFIVHVFTEDKRAFYGLDGLWGDAEPVLAGELSQGGPPGP